MDSHSARAADMETVVVALANRSYPIYIGEGLLSDATLWARQLPQNRATVISDSTVAPLYLERLAQALRTEGVGVTSLVLPPGEQCKDLRTLSLIFEALLDRQCERKTALIALGGGVIGDLTGFAAATYLRGVPYLQIPTTLLAQVDSSVGGKTAVNLPRGKNLVGAFYQPLAVVADTGTLKTLPARELSAGLAEVIKYGLMRDPAFFDWLEDHIEALVRLDPEALTHAVRRSCEIKAAVVAADEREESGERALLNLGHTFGHAIETTVGYGSWLHGEAVAAGMVLAAHVSEHMGLIKAAELARVVALLKRAHLPTHAPEVGLASYLEAMGLDKKVEGGKIRFILLRAIGSAFLTSEVPQTALAAALAAAAEHG